MENDFCLKKLHQKKVIHKLNRINFSIFFLQRTIFYGKFVLTDTGGRRQNVIESKSGMRTLLEIACFHICKL